MKHLWQNTAILLWLPEANAVNIVHTHTHMHTHAHTCTHMHPHKYYFMHKDYSLSISLLTTTKLTSLGWYSIKDPLGHPNSKHTLAVRACERVHWLLNFIKSSHPHTLSNSTTSTLNNALHSSQPAVASIQRHTHVHACSVYVTTHHTCNICASGVHTRIHTPLTHTYTHTPSVQTPLT